MRTVAAVIRNVLGQNRISPTVRRNTSWQYAYSDTLSHLWATFPAERETLRAYVDRAKAYRNDCGCTLGGIFVVVTLAILILYGFGYRRLSVGHLLLDAVWATACLCSAALLGKMMGIGLARIRLMLLGRELRSRYHGKEATHVNL